MFEEKNAEAANFGTRADSASLNIQNGIEKKGTEQITEEEFRKEAERFLGAKSKIEHTGVLQEVLDMLKPLDFRNLANLEPDQNITHRIFRILGVREILRIAQELNCSLCRNLDFVYVFNSEYWQLLDQDELAAFLGEALIRLGVPEMTARDYEFKGKLVKQFMIDAYLPKPESEVQRVKINLLNGTYEISENIRALRDFRRQDFLTYQLPFEFYPKADYPRWQEFLEYVLPDKSRQLVLAEYVGYVFARHLKLEKTLILYGTGANGKSVVFDVINALFGKENISNFSLESLGENYFRAMIANKLLNYSSEISNRLQADKFKQLTSGEPVEARFPYGRPMMLTNYARFIFNCNDLPKDVEHSEAFFRRFLILPFDVFIQENERNPRLAQEIIENELSGVFNWVLAGLERLLEQSGFSYCGAAQAILDSFRKESDSVAMFLDEEGYRPSDKHIPLKTLYQEYRQYCVDNGYRALGRNNFGKRLASNNVVTMRANYGLAVFVQRIG